MFPELARGFHQLVYPAICAWCEALVAEAEEDFCLGCATALTTDPHFTCPRCSSTVGQHVDVSAGCLSCRDDRFPFASASRLGPYEGPLRDAILQMKHQAGETLAAHMGRLWARHHADRFRSLGVEVVIPVPLHWWRRFRRGYNQSETLAAQLAQLLAVPHRPGWLRRIRRTGSQTHLPKLERRANVRGAFRATQGARLAGATVLLVDDVMTTGSTASEAARALRQAGAAAVHVATLARR